MFKTRFGLGTGGGYCYCCYYVLAYCRVFDGGRGRPASCIYRPLLLFTTRVYYYGVRLGMGGLTPAPLPR